MVLSCYKYKNGQITDYVSKPGSKWIHKHPEDLFHYEVNNYFKAWVKTCNHKEWEDKKDRWLTKGNEKGLIQKKAFFIILLEIFPLTRTMAEQIKIRSEGKGPLTTQDFMGVLAPFKWVDWTDRDIDNAFGGSGETSRRSLEVWLCDAILNKKQYSPDDIINENNQSLPGRGITSTLATPKIEIESDNKWPTKNKPLIVSSIRPFNARYVAEWRVEDQKENRVKNSKERTLRHQLPSNSRLKIYAHDINFKTTELNIRVDWSNMDKITGHNNIKIKRPKQL